MPRHAARRLVIVDAHSHALRAYHALAPMSAPDGLPTHAIFGLAGLLHRLVLDERPDFLAIVFDAPDDSRTTFRTALYPEYKAHRSPRPADLTAQMPVLRELAKAFGLTPLEHPAFEADDLIASLVALAEPHELETTILSADKDLMQLVSERTTLWDTMRGRRYTPDGVRAKLGVPPAAVADYLALVGDSSDNVPGVPGIGPKSAARLLIEHGDIDGVLARLDALPVREKKRLETCRELLLLSRELTRLRSDVPLPGPMESFAWAPPPLGTLRALFERLDFRSFPLPSHLEDGASAPATRPGGFRRDDAPRAERRPRAAPEPAAVTRSPLFPEDAPAAVVVAPAAVAPAAVLAPAAMTSSPHPIPVSPPPSPAPRKPVRLGAVSPSELARLLSELDPSALTGLELNECEGRLELTWGDAIVEVQLRSEPTPTRAKKAALPQPSLFDAPLPLSGPELAALLSRQLGAAAAHVALVRGASREPALPALWRWGAT